MPKRQARYTDLLTQDISWERAQELLFNEFNEELSTLDAFERCCDPRITLAKCIHGRISKFGETGDYAPLRRMSDVIDIGTAIYRFAEMKWGSIV